MNEIRDRGQEAIAKTLMPDYEDMILGLVFQAFKNLVNMIAEHVNDENITESISCSI